ncbi:putative methyltransferase-domain-containing protein [Limtongia smithiae]|uniref:putative methyltransferase-domain-containing protein n=1 Tax=Limtongia smithiae TaxID=1125753 RepID=UPI0034CF88E5
MARDLKTAVRAAHSVSSSLNLTQTIEPMATSVDLDFAPLASLLLATDLVPPAHDVTKFAGVDYTTSVAGVMEVDFNGTNVRIKHDGGATGCGGKLWPAGELLSRYLTSARDDSTYLAHEAIWGRLLTAPVRIVELGSGTGLVGIALANAYRDSESAETSRNTPRIIITDQVNMLELMQNNIKLNDVEDIVSAEVLDWGVELPERSAQPDVVLAADCVYFEPAFVLLEKTLLDLTTKDTLVLMSYKKRRKADNKFFKAIRKNFLVEEIQNYVEYESFHRESVFLYRLIRK